MTHIDPNYCDAQAIIDAALAAAEPEPLNDGGVYSVVVPRGGEHRLLDLEKHLPAPRRLTGTYQPATVEDLVRFVKANLDERHTTVWVHPTEGRVVAVINDHAGPVAAAAASDDESARDGLDPSAGWGDHRASLTLVPTESWKHWLARDGKMGDQADFAEHIETGLRDITTPAGAEMLEIAQTMQAHRTAEFRSGIRLHDGNVQITYNEDTTASAGASGQYKVPEKFTLALSPFIGEDAYAVTARLRYRIREGRLTIGYQLERPDDILRDALALIAEKLRGEFADRVYLGTAPAAR